MNFVSLTNNQSGAMDELLASYAAGTLSRPLHTLVASHLALKADHRAYVSTLEGMIADRMETGTDAPVANRDRRIDMILSDDDIPQPSHVTTAPTLIPPPLQAYLETPFESLAWRSVIPGLREVKLEDTAQGEVSLLWIRAGRAMPVHTHHGIEATLVLQGAFFDSTGHYGRGDISVVDGETVHRPVASQDEDCICFSVSEGPVKLTGPFGRLFQKLLRH